MTPSPQAAPPPPLDAGALVACHECDLLHRREPFGNDATARCARCGHVMFRHTHDSVRRTLCHTLAAVILFAIANLYPFMTFELHGREQEAVLFTGIRELHAGGFTALGALVLFTTIAAPALYFAGLLYMLVPLSLGRVPPRLAPVYRWTELLRPWGMIGVLMLGALVAIIKLVALANVELGIAFYALIGLMIFTAETQTTFDPEAIWQALEAGQ